MTHMSAVINTAMNEIQEKSRNRLYQTDFDAWSWDVLGRRQYKKLRDINNTIIHSKKTRNAIKSANGCGKSMDLGDLITWWVTCFPPEDSLAIISAPSLDQIDRVVFKYLKDNFGHAASVAAAKDMANPFPGWINESLEWQYKKMDGSGHEALAFGKRPTDQDIVSTFQGTRKLRTFVALDEAGGVPADLFTGAEAVMTGQDSKVVAIGNPDRRGTEFHRIFTVPALMNEWNTFTISAYDLPTVTGEIVYPDHPEKQERMMKGLTSKDWIEHKERVWKVGGKPDGRFLAKVLGEFPGETDNAFFPQEAIDKAHDMKIDKPEAPIVLGVDLARLGDDDSVVYVNQGGHVRQFQGNVKYSDREGTKTTTGVWSKENTVSSARRIHAIAMQLGADQVRLDSSGIGGAMFDDLEQLEEFDGKCYTLIGVNNSNSSSNNMRWRNIRAENHDNLRDMMIKGYVDMDPTDTQLRDELLVITYKLDLRGAVQITPKDEMKGELGGSPDRLDAVIYALADLDHIVSGPQPGERIEYDMESIDDESPFYSANFW